MGIFGNLFGSKNKTESLSDFSAVKVDLHSHLIPGIDDGSTSIEQSLEMIRALYDQGYRKLITTPHIMADYYPNTPEIIQKGLDLVREAIDGSGMEMEMEAAAEYYVDEGLQTQITDKNLLTFGGDRRFVLFETGFREPPMAIESIIFQLKSEGYLPVMAHPERYVYLWDKELEYFHELKHKGLLFQVNISSFARNKKHRASYIARLLADANLVDFVGTDLHSPNQLANLEMAKKNPSLARLINEGTLQNPNLV